MQYEEVKVGVLALQGAFAKHAEVLERLNVSPLLVRYPEQLLECRGLIIPGGESTTMWHLIRKKGFLGPLRKFSLTSPIFGTCAGLILMAKNRLGLLDIEVQRNGYGSQLDSFSTSLTMGDETCRGVFIRAPRIKKVFQNVEVLSSHGGEAVFVQQGRHMASAFHPELTDDNLIHTYFLEHLIVEPAQASA